MNKKLLQFIFLFCLSVFFIGCKKHTLENIDNLDLNRLVHNISNADIQWGGDYAGLFPILKGEDSIKIMLIAQKYPQKQHELVEYLIKCTTDDDKYVAAHVLLTYITTNKLKMSASEWNGLEVTIYNKPKSIIIYHKGMKDDISAFWKKKEKQLKTVKHFNGHVSTNCPLSKNELNKALQSGQYPVLFSRDNY